MSIINPSTIKEIAALSRAIKQEPSHTPESARFYARWLRDLSRDLGKQAAAAERQAAAQPATASTP